MEMRIQNCIYTYESNLFKTHTHAHTHAHTRIQKGLYTKGSRDPPDP